MEFEQQPGGESTGDASCNEQITDPGEQRRGICGGCQAPFEGLQLSNVLAAPQGIDQRVFSWPRLGVLSSGHGEVLSFSSVMALAEWLCHPRESGCSGTKKASVGSPRLDAFSSTFFMIWLDSVKGCRHI